VDTLVISLLDAIVNGTFGVTRVTSGVATTVGSGGYTSFTTQTTVDWPWLALLWVTYYAVLEGYFGATLGKRAAGLRVTDLEGRRIGWQAAIVRSLARLLDVLPFTYLLGGILTLLTKRHQRLGDLLAGVGHRLRDLSDDLAGGPNDPDMPRFHHARVELGFRRLGVQQWRVPVLAENLPLTLRPRAIEEEAINGHDDDEDQARPHGGR